MGALIALSRKASTNESIDRIPAADSSDLLQRPVLLDSPSKYAMSRFGRRSVLVYPEIGSARVRLANYCAVCRVRMKLLEKVRCRVQHAVNGLSSRDASKAPLKHASARDPSCAGGTRCCCNCTSAPLRHSRLFPIIQANNTLLAWKSLRGVVAVWQSLNPPYH
jgi:hypothetical protein